MPDKLTDSEIVKACKNCLHLEVCLKHLRAIAPDTSQEEINCVLRREGNCKNFIDKDLINRLQAENNLLRETNKQLNNSIDFVKVKDIAELKAENERLKVNNLTLEKCCNNCIYEEKHYKHNLAEAYKEFADRLKAVSHPYADTQIVFELQIDNLLKELVGE